MRRVRASDLVPPILFRPMLRLVPQPPPAPEYGFSGDYPDWQSAAAESAPYDLDLAITRQFLEETRRGERETGVNAAAMLVALLLGENANVLDVGGGLGVGYFRLAAVVPERIASWRVVEKPHVAAGGRDLADGKLSFWDSLEAASDGWRPDIALLSGVLEYLPDRYALLARCARLARHLAVIDRSPIGARERIMVQRVAPKDGGYVVPCAVLTREKIAAALPGFALFFAQDFGAFHAQVSEASRVSMIYERHR